MQMRDRKRRRSGYLPVLEPAGGKKTGTGVRRLETV